MLFFIFQLKNRSKRASAVLNDNVSNWIELLSLEEGGVCK